MQITFTGRAKSLGGVIKNMSSYSIFIIIAQPKQL